MPLKKLNKRHVTLLEVLIAFMLVAMCIFPLLYPHVAMFKDQAQFVNQIKLDHAINQLYADVYQKLQENQIPWGSIEQGQVFPVDLSTDKSDPLPYKGQYQFKIYKTKPSQPSPVSFSQIDVHFSFWDANGSAANPKYNATYSIFMARNLGGSGTSQEAGNAPKS